MSNSTPKKSEECKPQFCIATDQYDLMLLMALCPLECQYVGQSVQNGRYLGALFTYTELADVTLRRWHKLTECDFEEESRLKTFFYFLAHCQLYGAPRQIFEHWMSDKEHYAYQRQHIFRDIETETSHNVTDLVFQKEITNES
jgi:hypothetical protein